MLSSYRRRFVASNMLLVGIVLLAVLVGLGVTQLQSAYKEVRATMHQVLDQFDGPNEKFRSLEDLTVSEQSGEKEAPPEKPTGPVPDNADGTPPEKPERIPEEQKNENAPLTMKKRLASVERNKIVTAFYDSATGQISITKNVETTDDAVINEAVADLLEKEAPFGKLRDLGLFYFKESADGGWKIALANETYFTNQLLRVFAVYAAGFLLAMGLLLLISLWLSKLAARPMERAMELQRQFVDDVSHDLKTPITVILANNSIMKSNPEETVASQRQWLDATEDAAKGMMGMIHEMLSLSSLEAMQQGVQTVSVDLTSAAEKAVLQMESVAFDRGITLEDAIAEDVSALATTEYAERICNSLLDNALKYEPDGGRVCVTLQGGKKHAVLTVQNFGAVIAPEDLEHVFERFYRSDKVRASKSGHGLGLPILKQITSLIGATITAESSEKEGTVFRVTFAAGSSAAKNGL